MITIIGGNVWDYIYLYSFLVVALFFLIFFILNLIFEDNNVIF